MNKWPLVILCCLCFWPLFAQDGVWTVMHLFEAKAQRTYIDQLNNLYPIQQGEIQKWDENGRVLTRYSNKLIGENVSLDVTNPMKVILYAPEQMRLIFLDSRLAELREPINLFAAGYEQISLAATSHSNSVWLYDPINFHLIRLNQNLEEERRSLNLAQLLRIEFNPTDLIEVNNNVYLTDPKHGVFVFDVFGNFIRKIPIIGIRNLVISDNRLFFYKGETLYGLNLLDNREEEVKIPLEGTPGFYVNRDRVVVTTAGGIIIYAHKP